MEWIEINSAEELPKDGSLFICLCNGNVFFGRYNPEKNKLFIVDDPMNCQDYESVSEKPSRPYLWCINPEFGHNFTHYIKIPENPINSKFELPNFLVDKDEPSLGETSIYH